MPHPLDEPYYTVLMHPIYVPRSGHTQDQLNFQTFDTLPQAIKNGQAYTRRTGNSCHIFKCVAHIRPAPKPKPSRTQRTSTIRCKG